MVYITQNSVYASIIHIIEVFELLQRDTAEVMPKLLYIWYW